MKFAIATQVVAAALLFTLLAACGSTESPEVSARQPTRIVEVGVERETDDAALRLDEVVVSSVGLEARFSFALPAQFIPSSDSNLLAPMFLDQQIEIANATSDKDGLSIRVRPHQPGDTMQQFGLMLTHPVIPTDPIRITFNDILLDAPDGPFQMNGPWVFDLTPDMLGEEAATASSSPMDVSTDINGKATMRVTLVERRGDMIQITFRVESDEMVELVAPEQTLQLKADNGIVYTPASIQPSDRTDAAGSTTGMSWVASFTDVPTNVATANFLMTAVVINDSPSEIKISNPLGEWSSTPLLMRGERLAVTGVEQVDEGLYLTVVISNLEQESDATVLFLGIDAPEVSVTDDVGRRYTVESASTGMRRTPGSSMAAGESTIRIAGPIDSSARSLTILPERSATLWQGTSASTHIEIP